MTAQLGLCLGYFGLTLNSGSLAAYYVRWGILAVLSAGTSPIVWTRAVISWFERGRGLALGITLCGTGIVAVVGPGIIGSIIAAHGWKAGFYALSAAKIVIGWPLVFAFLKVREQAGPTGWRNLPTRGNRRGGNGLESVLATHHRLRIDFDRNRRPHRQLAGHAGRSGSGLGSGIVMILSLLGFAIIAGRLSIGWLVDWLSARVVAPVYILLPALSCVLLAHGTASTLAILLIGLASGAEVDLAAYLVSRYFGMRNYAKIYGWILAVFSAGVGTGPVFAGCVDDTTGTYVAALYTFAIMVVVATALIGSLGRPDLKN